MGRDRGRRGLWDVRRVLWDGMTKRRRREHNQSQKSTSRLYNGQYKHRQITMNELLSQYTLRLPRPISLYQLLSFGKHLSSDKVLLSAGYTLEDLPRRFADRVRSLQDLPFIVGTNPYISKSLDAHRDSFTWLATHPSVTRLSENTEFAHQLSALVQKHSNDIPRLAQG